MWSADRNDSLLDGQRHNGVLTVTPDSTTTYTLYTDYGELPRCPATTSITMNPLVPPKAQMRVSPEQLSPEHLTYEARDISESYFLTRTWLIDSVVQPNDNYIIYGEAAPTADTVEVWLVLYDGHCSDTAIALLPIRRSSFETPNAFTPDADNNNRFTVAGINIAEYEINIYNRRGILVYHSTDIGAGWDGRNLHGEPCPPGSYVYHVRYSTIYRPSLFQKVIGSVLLIR